LFGFFDPFSNIRRTRCKRHGMAGKFPYVFGSLANVHERVVAGLGRQKRHTIYLFAVMEALAQLGITHRRTAYHRPEGNSYIRTLSSQLEGRGSLDF